MAADSLKSKCIYYIYICMTCTRSVISEALQLNLIGAWLWCNAHSHSQSHCDSLTHPLSPSLFELDIDIQTSKALRVVQKLRHLLRSVVPALLVQLGRLLRSFLQRHTAQELLLRANNITAKVSNIFCEDTFQISESPYLLAIDPDVRFEELVLFGGLGKPNLVQFFRNFQFPTRRLASHKPVELSSPPIVLGGSKTKLPNLHHLGCGTLPEHIPQLANSTWHAPIHIPLIQFQETGVERLDKCCNVCV